MIVVAGEPAASGAELEALRAQGREAVALAPVADRGEEAAARLGAALLGAERALTADPPELVVLADDSDAALAALLAAAKLLVAIEARPRATSGGGDNARLIRQLAVDSA